MTTYTFPAGLVPNSSEWWLESNTQTFVSPLSRTVQTAELAGARWRSVMEFSNLRDADARAMAAFLVKLRGQANRFQITDWSIGKPRGVATGAPVISNRQNMLLYSEQFGGGLWTTQYGCQVTDDIINDPDGNLTADKIADDATASADGAIYRTIGTGTGSPECISIYLKYGNHARTDFGIWQASPVNDWAGLLRVNWDGGGAITSIATAAGSTANEGYTAVADGWYRIWFSCTPSASASELFYIYPTSAADDTASDYSYAWGAQVQHGTSTVGPYQVATTASVASISQAGSSIITGGWTAGQAGILLAGDYIGVNGELKMVIADANSDGAGNATLTIEPPLRSSPADNAAITVTYPTCTMMLANNDARWSNTPGDYHSFVLDCVEAFT